MHRERANVARLQRDVMQAAADKAALNNRQKAVEQEASEAASRAQELARRLDEAQDAAERKHKVHRIIWHCDERQSKRRVTIASLWELTGLRACILLSLSNNYAQISTELRGAYAGAISQA